MIYLRGGDPLTMALNELERVNRGSCKQRPNAAGFPIDVSETKDKYLVSCDLPGVSKDDVKLDLEQRTLSISIAQPKKAETEAVKDKKQDDTQDGNETSAPSSPTDEAKQSHDHAETKEEAAPAEPAPAKRQATAFLLRERTAPRGSRKLEFESELDIEHISATFTNGVLQISVPKKQPVVHKIAIA
ncbi:Small heat shock protein hspG12 [Hondaea fermentalgiana]|uniref:Small heat shock protein hspG12 n=1 Tax=Hondaea fermentalgiana TaxID=2315210 RepID=A0A2R5GFD3_9STRA|nr:Small heat shock protein hspG12 [Hondaea fermentalgiana]|eukprot:GBG29039.1 Small heat shock protein hspG12 [Hondaea fermentalgiana]